MPLNHYRTHSLRSSVSFSLSFTKTNWCRMCVFAHIDHFQRPFPGRVLQGLTEDTHWVLANGKGFLHYLPSQSAGLEIHLDSQMRGQCLAGVIYTIWVLQSVPALTWFRLWVGRQNPRVIRLILFFHLFHTGSCLTFLWSLSVWTS